jgi:hypothetical protein
LPIAALLPLDLDLPTDNQAGMVVTSTSDTRYSDHHPLRHAVINLVRRVGDLQNQSTSSSGTGYDRLSSSLLSGPNMSYTQTVSRIPPHEPLAVPHTRTMRNVFNGSRPQPRARRLHLTPDASHRQLRLVLHHGRCRPNAHGRRTTQRQSQVPRLAMATFRGGFSVMG